MPITTAPFLMNDVSITLTTEGGPSPEEYRCQLRRAELVPSTGTAGGADTTWEGFCDTFDSSAAGNATWSLELEMFQAGQDALDLSRFLFAQEGSVLDYVLIPAGGVASATNPSYSGQVTAVPTNIGGSANSYAQSTVSLPTVGKPTENVA